MTYALGAGTELLWPAAGCPRAASRPVRSPRRVVLLSHSAAETRALGWRLGKCVQGDEILALSGPLGSGKTCLVQGLGRGLGVRRFVNSPSFVLMKRYRARLSLIHWDWYRLDDKTDLESSGFGDLQVERGIVVIEWADRFLDQIARPFLLIEITPTGLRSRRLTLSVQGKSAALRRLVGDLELWWAARRKNDGTDLGAGH